MIREFFAKLFAGKSEHPPQNESAPKASSSAPQPASTPPAPVPASAHGKQSAWRRFLSGFFKDLPPEETPNTAQLDQSARGAEMAPPTPETKPEPTPSPPKAELLKEVPVDNFPLGIEPTPSTSEPPQPSPALKEAPIDETPASETTAPKTPEPETPAPETPAQAPLEAKAPTPQPQPAAPSETTPEVTPEPEPAPEPEPEPEPEPAKEQATEPVTDPEPTPAPASEPIVEQTPEPPAAPEPVTPEPVTPEQVTAETAAPETTALQTTALEADIQEPQTPPQDARSFFARLKDGLTKTSHRLTDGLSSIFTQRKLDDDTLEELEDLLITADLGVDAAMRVTTALAKDRFDKEISDTEVKTALAEEVAKTLTPLEKPLSVNGAASPHVILMTGVNGAGKTTTIGKLASKFKADGKSVMLAAGDTFRAAAIEQLTIWGERTGSSVIARETGADAAGLAFDALQQAKDENIDVLLIDTAGRLQNKRELMDELAKIVRVLKKIDPNAPHDTLLVLDATVGQNALSQAEAFSEIAGVTGLVMTKLDGTARGGVLVALGDKFSLPIHFVGVGEGIDDLQEFNAASFSKALAGLDEPVS